MGRSLLWLRDCKTVQKREHRKNRKRQCLLLFGLPCVLFVLFFSCCVAVMKLKDADTREGEKGSEHVRTCPYLQGNLHLQQVQRLDRLKWSAVCLHAYNFKQPDFQAWSSVEVRGSEKEALVKTCLDS